MLNLISNPLRNAWQQKYLTMDVTHPSIQEAADEAEQFCLRLYNRDAVARQLVFIGDSGCGKSHLAKKIYKWGIGGLSQAFFNTKHWGSERKPSTHFQLWPEFVKALVDKKNPALDDLLGADFLVLDDIGAENDPWGAGKDCLCQVLTRREGLFTVITTNIQPTNWAEKFDPRIADRLMRGSRHAMIAAPSYAEWVMGK